MAAEVKPKKLILSPSRIKSFDNCTWAYHCNYTFKIPSDNNDGARRGSICHKVFEILRKERHHHYVQKILDCGDFYSIGPLKKWAKKLFKYHGLTKRLDREKNDNKALVNEMIMVGLETDFFDEGASEVDSEIEFIIEDEGFTLRGIIDRLIKYKENNKIVKVKIKDYKSSKKKFSGKDEIWNWQTLCYSYYVFYKYGIRPTVEFIFLRFPKKPVQVQAATIEQLESMGKVLAAKTKEIEQSKPDDKFGASHPSTKSLCGSGDYAGEIGKNGCVKWYCGYKFPFTYWAKDKETSLTEREGWVKMQYNGCKFFFPENYRNGERPTEETKNKET